MWFSLVFTFSALAVEAALPAVDARTARPAERALLARAGDYLAFLFAGDLASAGRLMAEDVLFEDPTAALVNGVGVRIRGREDVLAAFELTRRPEEVSGVVRSSFAVGARVVAQVALRARVPVGARGPGAGGVAGARGGAGCEPGIDLVASGTTVLEFSDSGLIARHVDFADYRRLLDGLATAGGVG